MFVVNSVLQLRKKFFKILFIFRGEGQQKEGEKHLSVVASPAPPTGDMTRNPGVCPNWVKGEWFVRSEEKPEYPDWESNLQPFASQSGTRSTEPHQPGQKKIFFNSWGNSG